MSGSQFSASPVKQSEPCGFEGANLRLELLGRFRVSCDRAELSETAWRGRNAAQLVKRLAVAPDYTMLREQLVDLLWPNVSVSSSANSLRQALHVARRHLRTLALDPDLVLRSHGDRVQLYPPNQVWTDVHAFEETARRAFKSADPHLFWAAIDRYRGPFLPDDLYEDWTIACRERLAASYVGLLDHVSQLHDDRGELQEASDALRMLVAAEPTHERAHARLIRLYATSGQRTRAIGQYFQLVDALSRFLDIAPEPETDALYQQIKTESGPLVSVSTVRHQHPDNLPHAITSFIGRDEEVTDVIHLIRQHRLITLTGPGGIGKTRLALEAARKISGRFPEGVWLVRLAGLADPALVGQAIGDALRIGTETHDSPADTLIASLRDSEILLILDNCEHLIGACASLAAALVSQCPKLRIMATSREALGVPGERAWTVSSLSLPPPSASFAELMQNDALRLFVDRVGWHQPGFALTPDNAEAIYTICRRLDGLPLALELAAARASVVSLAQLASRLDDALAVLTSGSRHMPTRQQTLRGTLDWSYRLLDENERTLFRRLAVFSGGWTLDLAEAVCAGDGLPAKRILHFHGQLVAKSLVQVTLDTETAHYRLLEPVRQYAMEQLRSYGEADLLGERHATYFVSFLEAIERDLSGRRQVEALDLIEPNHDNLRAALRWAIQHGEAEIALRIEAVLWRYWGIRWHSTEGLDWIQNTLALPSASRTAAFAWAALGGGELARRILEFGRSIALLEKALEIHRELDDISGTAWSLIYLANALSMAERFDESRAKAQESLPLFRSLDDKRGLARALNTLAEDARLCGDYATADTHYQEALEIDRMLGDQQGIATRLHNLGYVALYQGNPISAVRSFRESYMLNRELGYQSGLLSFLEGMAASASAASHPDTAARLYGAWEANCALPGTEFKLHPPDQLEFDRYTALARAAIGNEAFEQAWDEGRLLSLDQAVIEALAAQQVISLKTACSPDCDRAFRQGERQIGPVGVTVN